MNADPFCNWLTVWQWGKILSFKGVMRCKYRYISLFTFIFNTPEAEDGWGQNEGGRGDGGKWPNHSPFADHMIQEQTEVIHQPVVGHLVKQLVIEVLVDVHGTGRSTDFGLISKYKLVSRLMFLMFFYWTVHDVVKGDPFPSSSSSWDTSNLLTSPYCPSLASATYHHGLLCTFRLILKAP